MEDTMKSFADIREAAGKVTYNHARKWVFDRLENTDHTHDKMKKDFHAKFGKHNAHHFDKAVSEYMD
jgi:hypothetical protein